MGIRTYKRRSNDVTGLVSGYQTYSAKYSINSGGTLRTAYLEIAKVPKEEKYRNAAYPLIRLFCKSLGKCGV
jgi:hypothetical protein